MYSIVWKDAHCAGKLFLMAVWAVGLAAGLGLLLGMREL
jgi:hypothetical protein